MWNILEYKAVGKLETDKGYKRMTLTELSNEYASKGLINQFIDVLVDFELNGTKLNDDNVSQEMQYHIASKVDDKINATFIFVY